MTGGFVAAASPVTWVPALVVGLAVGLVAGRVARRAADADRGRSGGSSSLLIEAVTAGAVVLGVFVLGRSWEIIPYLVVVTASVATGVTDLRSHRIPDRIVFPSLLMCAVAMLGAATVLHQPHRLWLAACGAVTFSAILLAVHLVAPAGLGRGDVKFAVLLGAAVGWLQPTALATVEAVVWSLLAASVIGLAWAFVGHRSNTDAPDVPLRRRRVPFGPAMSTATLGVVVAAETFLR